MSEVLDSGDPEEWLADTKQDRFETFRDESVVGEHCKSCQYDPDPVIKKGSLEADLMVVGSVPSSSDYKSGVPFFDTAGELLEEMLGAIDLAWETDCYLTNALLCGYSGDRPGDSSVDSCRVNVNRQIELVAPDAVLALGKYAYCSLYHQPVDVDYNDHLGPAGNLPDFPWLEGVATVHPRLIRDASEGSDKRQKLKRLAWKHLQQTRDILDTEDDPEPETQKTSDPSRDGE